MFPFLHWLLVLRDNALIVEIYFQSEQWDAFSSGLDSFLIFQIKLPGWLPILPKIEEEEEKTH